MNGKNFLILTSLLLLISTTYLLLGVATYFPAALSSITIVYVYPDNYIANYVGESFVIQVRVYNVINLTAYQFKLRFSNTLLKCLSASVGTIFPPPPRSNYTVAINNTEGTIYAQVSLQAGENPASGSGSLLALTFNATAGTPYPQPRKSCTLEIFDDYLFGTGNPPQMIQHETFNGTYQSPYIPPQLTLTLNINRKNVHFDEKAILNGTLCGNGYPIPDALVGLEVDTPNGKPIIARSLATSSLKVTGPIEILELTPCSLDGTPTYSFKVSTIAYFKVKIKNNAPNNLNVTITVNPYDFSNASLGVASSKTTICSGQTITVMFSVPIEKTSMSGNATVYANAFTDLPSYGGTPLSMEKSATFIISGSAQGTPTYISPPPQGTYITILNIHYTSHSTGNYTIVVTAQYMGSYATQSKKIFVSILGDINMDGTVNLQDLVLLAKAYGSKPGAPNWNPKADLDGNGAVGLSDLVLLAKNYGKT
jgi:hypothetical protein